MPGEIVMSDTTLRGLQEQINTLGTRMDKGLDEIKTIVSGFDVRVRNVELKEANCNPILTAKVDAAWRKLDEHDAELKEVNKVFEKFNKSISDLVHNNKKLEEHDAKFVEINKAIEELKKTTSELVHTNKILKWILGVLTVLITSYLVNILIGG